MSAARFMKSMECSLDRHAAVLSVEDRQWMVRLSKALAGMYADHDPAHSAPHFVQVLVNARKIERAMHDKEPDLFVAYTSERCSHLMAFFAMYHDLFANQREKHHQLASEYVLADDTWTERLIPVDPWIQALLPKDRELLAEACLKHRASNELPFNTLFAEVAACADRGIPSSNIREMVERAFKYARYNNPTGNTRAWVGITLRHLQEKFGPEGYASFPRLIRLLFPEKLQEQRAAVGRLTESVIISDYCR